MSRLLIAFFAVSILGHTSFFAQKHAVGEKDYRTWKKISSQRISDDGAVASYMTEPLLGDAYQYLYQSNINRLDSFDRGGALSLTEDNRFALFKISPGYDTIRSLKLENVKKSKWPKDSLGIYDLSINTLTKEPNVYSYQVAEEGNTFAYIQEEQIESKGGLFAMLFASNKETTKESRYVLKVYGSYPILSLKQSEVKKFSLSPDGSRIAYIASVEDKDKQLSEKMVVRSTVNGEQIVSFPLIQKYKVPIWSSSSEKMAFFFSNDTTHNNYELKVYDFTLSASLSFGDTLDPNLDRESVPSQWRTPFFSKDEERLFFGVHQRAYEEAEDSLLKEEKARLDVWHYEDGRIQPQQLKQLKRDKKKNHLYVYNFRQAKLIQLSNDTLDVIVSNKYEPDYALAYSREAYQVESQWSYPWMRDYYRISIDTGVDTLVRRRLKYPGRLSLNGRFFSYFDEKKKEHVMIDLQNKEESCMTCGVDSVVWHRDINGMSFEAGPERIFGFTRTNDYVFQSEWDLWSYSPSTDTLRCISDRQGEQRQIKLTLNKKNWDSVYVDFTDTYVSGLNKLNKSMHLFNWLEHEDHYDLIENMISPHKLVSLVWSEDGKNALLRRSSVSRYPDLEKVDEDFQNPIQISTTNPHQKDVYWPSVELVKWYSYDSVLLEGLVYLPENYDTSTRYPLMIYYYELNSDNLHSYRSPRPSASIINPIEYASNDYLVFIPDIRYEEGHPGKSAYSSIMSGTDYLLKKYAIDSLKMGLQGQSWGGYQTAQMVTMTNRYAAAMAGAPVSNMFSAYGGIRWGSGLNRQFQYEATQSRIGKTIWEAPELYYENSPIFHLPNIETPLLIMHNDNDGAVPWYQGIEMYTGMRRLGKPCWMLVYNNDGHNLKKLANKFDLSIRMNQFFDYYLKDAPQPEWMEKGIPALEKGENNGYQFNEK